MGEVWLEVACLCFIWEGLSKQLSPSVSPRQSRARCSWPSLCLTPQHRGQLLIKYFSNKDLSVWGDNLFLHHSNACPYTELKLASLETLPMGSSFFFSWEAL